MSPSARLVALCLCLGACAERDCPEGSRWYKDVDGDGYGQDAGYVCAAGEGRVQRGGDCDDGELWVHPGGVESCDGRDDDCDGEVDEAGAQGEVQWYADADEDGFGTHTAVAVACQGPAASASNGEDCDDTDPGVHPGALERCDAVDQDCDGQVDEEAVDAVTGRSIPAPMPPPRSWET